MEESHPLEPVKEPVETPDETLEEEDEEEMPVPFGMMGVAFLCNVLQYAVLLGLTMLVLMMIHYFGPAQ